MKQWFNVYCSYLKGLWVSTPFSRKDQRSIIDYLLLRGCMISSLRRLTAMAAVEEGPVARLITQKLKDRFKPAHLSVACESHMHNVPRGAEMHFLVQVVADEFEGKTVLQRHRLVNECLAQELREGVHALRIDAVPTSKWTGEPPIESPKCLGGSKK